MTSEKQIDVNRLNALLSIGPITEPGRKISRMNALRHGLTGQVAIMTDEDRAACGKCLEYQPANSRQDGFVFSNAQIHAAIHREQRLQPASATDFTKYRPRKFHAQAA